MSAGDFAVMPPKVCRVCGVAGEFSGFMVACPACRAAVLSQMPGTPSGGGQT